MFSPTCRSSILCGNPNPVSKHKSDQFGKMGTIFKKIFILFFFLQAFTFQSFLFPQIPVRDQVTDTIRCRDAITQSYALYLPSQYDNKKSLPVILIFDPSARGRTGVNTFIEGAGKYGFILACSNNSRNGPMGDNFTAAAAMLQDVQERFTVDQKRIYVAGFSGGSRFALAYAVKEKKISGVIGCGAGLPNDRNYMPTANSGFVYFGLAGSRDMNYLEMHDLPDFFNNQTRVISYLRTFSGGHEWPGPDLMTESIEWLILQAMNRKIIPADQTFLSYIENKTQNLIRSQLSSGNQAEGIMYMRFAVRDFQGTPFASGMTQLLTDSEKSAEYDKAIRKWNKMAANEQEKREIYLIYLSRIFKSGSLPDSASTWWQNETRALIRLRDKGSTENSQMASRILNFISILCSEQGTSYYRNRLYTQAAFLFEICTLSDSENQNNYYNLARSLAGSGRLKESVDALSVAVSHGFNSRKTVDSDPAFVKIRDDARYKALLLKMK
jgi:pimeloyl-ACP methyl ester carboxylesterase